MDFPQVEIGDIVYWYFDADTMKRPTPGIVVLVGPEGTLSLVCWDTNNSFGRSKDGIVHASDPRANNEHFRGQGCWDLTDATKLQLERDRRMHVRVEALAERVVKLEKQARQEMQQELDKRVDVALAKAGIDPTQPLEIKKAG